MECKGIFVYKSLSKRSAGQLTNAKGEVVQYPESYILKADELHEGKIDERKYNIPTSSTSLINRISPLNPYTKVEILFDLNVYASGSIKLVPKDIKVLDNK